MASRRMWFDKQGNPLSDYARIENLCRDVDYKRIAEDTLAENGLWVSTVWLGLNHNWGDGPPLIFETMVFRSQAEFHDLDCDRYATEAEAREGHTRMVAKWRSHRITVDEEETGRKLKL